MQGGEGNAAAGIATSEVIDVHEVVPGRPDTRDLVIDLREQSSDDEAVETTDAESGDESSAAAPPTGELHGRVAVVTGGASGSCRNNSSAVWRARRKGLARIASSRMPRALMKAAAVATSCRPASVRLRS